MKNNAISVYKSFHFQCHIFLRIQIKSSIINNCDKGSYKSKTFLQTCSQQCYFNISNSLHYKHIYYRRSSIKTSTTYNLNEHYRVKCTSSPRTCKRTSLRQTHFWVPKLIKRCTADPYNTSKHFQLTWHDNMTCVLTFNPSNSLFFSRRSP